MTSYADDCEAIRQLAAEYNWRLDAGEVEAWVACFTEDGAFSCVGLPEGDPRGGEHVGHAALLAYGRQHYAINQGRVRHWNWNLLIDVDGDLDLDIAPDDDDVAERPPRRRHVGLIWRLIELVVKLIIVILAYRVGPFFGSAVLFYFVLRALLRRRCRPSPT